MPGGNVPDLDEPHLPVRKSKSDPRVDVDDATLESESVRALKNDQAAAATTASKSSAPPQRLLMDGLIFLSASSTHCALVDLCSFTRPIILPLRPNATRRLGKSTAEAFSRLYGCLAESC